MWCVASIQILPPRTISILIDRAAYRQHQKRQSHRRKRRTRSLHGIEEGSSISTTTGGNQRNWSYTNISSRTKDRSSTPCVPKQSPQWLYEQVYCQRGEIENRIKELHELQ